MQTLTANLNGKVRKELLSDREYLVAPVTLVVPGVLNGNKGPLLYEEQDLALSADAWNGMPLVLDHPKVNGQHVSARSVPVLDKFGLGQVFNTRMADKLTAEAWFDVERTQKIRSDILANLQSGTSIELSTGLFTRDEPAQGEFNGKVYNAIARQHRPDHLAILPDGIGACSVNDGCGVLVNESAETVKESFWNWLTGLVSNEPSSSNNNGQQADPILIKGEKLMALKDERKKELVDGLIANCDCYAEKDRETLNALDDNDLVSKHVQSLNEVEVRRNKESTAVLDKATQPIKTDEGEFTFNSEKNEWSFAKAEPKTEDKPVSNDDKPQTTEEWLKSAPEEVRNTFNHSKAILDREKSQLIELLTANTADDKKESAQNLLATKTIEELQILNSLLPQNDEPARQHVPAYFGASGAVANAAVAGFESASNSRMPVFSLTDFDDRGLPVKSA